MFILSGTITLLDGSTITGAAIKDGGLATVASTGRSVRYVGDVMYAANAGLSDLVAGQDLVTRLYSNSSFVSFITALLTAGMAGTANTPSVSATIRESVWQFAAHLPSGEYLRVLGSSSGEPPAIRSSSLAAAIALLDADGDFAPPTGIMAGVFA